MTAAAAVLVVGLAASPALAQPDPAVTATTVPGASPTTTPSAPVPAATKAAPGTYSSPRWLPLRRDLPGTEVTVGCTLDSHGSQHGYECSGHHDRWAIDFIADTGTPVFAAGAGFATNLTGKPGGSGFGNVISIDHGFGITTLYAHLSEASIPAEGQWVDETTLLGKVGQTGSASTPHLHFEEFSNPGGSNSTRPVSIDPGALFACRGDLLVSFPQIAGYDSWAGLAWGSLTVASDGNGCTADAIPNDLIPAGSTTPLGQTASSTTDTDAGPATGDEPAQADAADTTEAETDAGTPWSDLIAPVLNLVGSTGERLHLPT